MLQVHQLVQGFAPGDATSNMARTLQRLVFQLQGGPSHIFAPPGGIHADLASECRAAGEIQALAGAESVLLYHFGNASPMTEAFLRTPGRKALVFHNVTPPEYFRAFAPVTARLLEDALSQLRALEPHVALALPVSHFNRQTLHALGYRNIRLFPAWIDTDALEIPAAACLPPARPGTLTLLFVGRLVPNKKIEDLLRLLHFLQTLRAGRPVRLVVAGSCAGMELYHAYLLALARDMGLREVFFTGHIPQSMLNGCYRGADAFVCASEHEGFCIPLLEAAHFGLPVFAFDIPAVRETLAGAGVLWTRRDFPLAAESLLTVMDNPALRAAVVERQRRRLADFGPAPLRERFSEILDLFRSLPATA